MRHLLMFLIIFITRLTFSEAGSFDSLHTALAKHRQNDTNKVKLLNELSYQYRWIDFVRSQQFADQALEIAKRLNDNGGMATANCRIAHCYWALGDNELAIEKGLEAAAIAEQNQFDTILGESFLILSRCYLDLKEIKKADLYIHKSEKIALLSKDWDLLSRVYNFEGVIKFVKHEEDSALLMYNKALQIVKTQNTSKAQLAQITSNIGECYLERNPDLGFRYFREALLISKAEKSRNRSAEASISSIMGHAFTMKGDYREADRYLLEALRLSKELGLRRSIRHAYDGLVKLKTREGLDSEALGYLRKYYNVRDSMLNVTKTRQIVELETKHEMEKKELAIQLLARDNKINALWTNILIISLVLIFGSAASIFYLQWYREKKNRETFNHQIDSLTAQHKELSEKYKDVLAGGNDLSIESADQRLVKRSIELIEKNISDPLFGVEQMARELGMSRTNMHRKLKAITGFPPSELIRNIRLRRAAKLLLKQADSVSQISLKVGFEDHSYFSKSFKKQFGVPPSEFLQSAKQPDKVMRLGIQL